MKYIKIINYVAIIIMTLFVISCKHDHAEGDHSGHSHGHSDHSDMETGHSTDTHDDHDDHSASKIVHLNPAQYKNANITVGKFESKNLSDVIHANGYTKVDPQDEADISMPINGNIKSIKIIEGDYVRKGQTIATMTSMEYNTILLQKAELTAELNSINASLNYLNQEYNRQQILSKENVSAKKIFEKVSSDLNIAKTKISSLQQQLSLVENTIALIGTSSGSTINIPATISGYITDVYVRIGTAVGSGKTLFSIVDNAQMHVDLLVYEKDLNKVQVGQTVRFLLTNQTDKEIKGKIYNIGKSFENDTKSVAVHADIEKNNANLITGMYVNALIDIGNNMVNTLPQDAIVSAEGRDFIFVLDDDLHYDHKDADGEYQFTRIEVKRGASQLGNVEVTILQDIADNQKMVKSGAYYVQSHLQKGEGGGSHQH